MGAVGARHEQGAGLPGGRTESGKDRAKPQRLAFTQPGPGLGDDAAAAVDELTAGLLDGSVELFAGPLVLQDGTTYVADGEVATDQQVWYFPGLLEGIDGTAETQE